MAIPTAAALNVSTAASSRSTARRARGLSRGASAGAEQRAAGEPGVVEREARDLGGECVDAAEAEAQRPACVVGRARRATRRPSRDDHARGGGRAERRAGRIPAMLGSERGAFITVASAAPLRVR